MRRRHELFRRGLVVVTALAVVASGSVASGAVGAAGARPASSAPISRPGGLLPGEVAPAGDCGLSGVRCKPSESTSCTGYSSQSTPPATIKVLLNSAKIVTVPFQTYVENVLPNEWISSWDEDALGAGAVAVKSYAWYWVTHFGGYLTTKSNCFDVTDDTDFQVYKANSQNDRTTAAVLATWPVAVRRDGKIVETSYRGELKSSSETCGTDANGSVLSQWGTQNCNEASSGNKFNVILGKYYYPGIELASSRQLRTAHDFQFQQRSTRAVYDSPTSSDGVTANGHWVIDDGYPTTFTYGIAGDKPEITTGGDGFAHIGVFRPSTGTWYVADPTGKTMSKIQFGVSSDVPVQAQYAGVSEPTVLAVFRPSNGGWYQADSSGGVASHVAYGTVGDIPVPGHYFGTSANDYADGIALFRPGSGVWHVRGHRAVQFGERGDIPMPADYNGNGTTDIAVYRPSNHMFYLRGYPRVHYGNPGDIPVTGDFTGDGRADLALYRPSDHSWHVYGTTSATFGSAGDTPVGKAPYHD